MLSSIPGPLSGTPSGFTAFLQNCHILGVALVDGLSFLIHFTLYAVLGFLAGRAMTGCEHLTRRAFLLALALCILFGLLDELYQVGVPGRGFQWIDMVANTIGAVFGLFFFASKRLADKVTQKGT